MEIVIVAYGAPELLQDALAPLAGLSVTIVDNSSQPRIAELARAAGAMYLDPGANLGFGAGVNYALEQRQMPGADVLLLNPDAVVDADVIAQLHSALHGAPRIATAGAAQRDADGRTAQVTWPYPRPAQYLANALTMGRLLRDKGRYVIGSVLMINADALRAIGGFDETFFLYAEEADWQYRAYNAGWANIVVEEAVAMHVGAATSSDMVRREVFLQAGQERFLRKHHGDFGWQVSRWAVVLGAVIRFPFLRGERAARSRSRARLFWRVPTIVEAGMRARG